MEFRPQHAVLPLILALWLVAAVVFAPPAQAQIPSIPQQQTQPPPASQEPPAQGEQSEQPAEEETQPRRLILKNGSYQPTVRWEERGDRIRYLSAERNQWEEIPKDLIDWEATNQYHLKRNPTPEMRRAREAEIAAEAAAIEAEERRIAAELDETNPEIAPGLRLPDGQGVYLLDVFRQKPQLAELIQNGGKINADRGRNILRAAVNPLAKTKQKIELEGSRARIHAHIPDPVIFLNIEQESSDEPEDLAQRFHIARMKTEKRTRVVGVIEFAFYNKQAAQKTDVIPSKITRVNAEWIQVKPVEPLPIGEYAVVEMIGKDVNLYVWDFGVDPRSPENPPKWEPPLSKEEKKKEDKKKDSKKTDGKSSDPRFPLPI
ncbi:MAG: hypothetical protein AB7O65_03505 [Candidatus Korobacteraceae bacterium]